MLALDLDQVRTIAAVLTTASTLASFVSAWLMKSVTKKIVFAAIFLSIAAVVWTQRTAVTSCASDAASNALRADTTCTFFGADVTLPTGRG